MPPCPECGFDPTGLSPSDAIAALRSLPRRYRQLVQPDPDADPEEERDPDAAVEAAGEAAEAISALTRDLRKVLIETDPALGTTTETATAVRNPGDPATALDRLAAAVDAAVAAATGQPGEAWSRAGTRPSGPVSAADLLRDAVHAGVHRLRAAGG